MQQMTPSAALAAADNLDPTKRPSLRGGLLAVRLFRLAANNHAQIFRVVSTNAKLKARGVEPRIGLASLRERPRSGSGQLVQKQTNVLPSN